MAPNVWRRVVLAAVAVAGALCALAGPAPAAAHPADRLVQHLVVQLAASEARLSIAIGGGILANELVLEDLDPDHNGRIDAAEARTWAAAFLRDIRVMVDGREVTIDPATVGLTVPRTEDFHLGLSPLIVAIDVPLPATAGKTAHRLVVRNDYRVDRTDFRIDVQAAAGARLLDQGWPSPTARIAFETDPALAASGGVGATDTASTWGTGGILARAKRVLERPKTPGLIATLIGVFVLMGALHAIQPGHGKTLVAAYLVATKGTARDALLLAAIVTFTHTVSVFALGLATLVASQIFLPSRVLPVLGMVSGLLVASMGLTMLRGALPRARGTHHHHLPDHDHAPHAHDHDDHASLSAEEHARFHLADVAAVRRGAPKRSLVTLGISGGLVPCPDALAILLLAVGINQVGLGMLAIVAFSLGLAGVLVAFGVAITLVGPRWTRVRRSTAGRSGSLGPKLGPLFGRLVAVSPLISATVVLLLGLAMLWRASAGA